MKFLITTTVLCLLALIGRAQWNTSGNDIYNTNTGNVGIGTSTPQALLEVSPPGDYTQVLWPAVIRNPINNNSTGYGVGIKLKNSSYNSGEVNKWAGVAAVGAGSGYSNWTDLAFYTNNSSSAIPSEKFRITGAGNVGIGTGSPTHSLTFPKGSTGIALYNTSDQTTNYERVVQQWSGNVFMINTALGGTGTLRDLYIGAGTTLGTTYSSGGGIKILNTFTSSGSGAAGGLIASQGQLLAAIGTQRMFTITPNVTQSGTAGYAALTISSFENTVGSGAKLLIDAGTSGSANNGGTYTSKFTLDSSGNGYFAGNVGIGITSPSSTLEIYTGTSNNANGLVLSQAAAATGTSGRLFFYDATAGSGGANTIYRNGGSLQFTTGGTPGSASGTARMTLDSSGRLGIGTTSPDQKLTVNGQVHATSVVVTSTVPADYVFDTNYHLRPLTDVKAFVDKNHHLP
ncbi:MAG TPA: hypothetical protein VHA56_12710, partial [Mucilaginibacter sp.]|nr:hypothetical protein [Mucilaginibacter sp.]